MPLSMQTHTNMFHTQPAAGILQYLLQTHDPLAIIVIGSYADGSCDEASDFDAWLFGRDEGRVRHDASVVNHVPLHVQIYPVRSYETIDPELMKIFAGAAIAHDPEGHAQRFLERVEERLSHWPCMPKERKRQKITTMQSLLRRARKQDFAGDHRGHLLLSDSLEAWCDLSDRIFLSTNKTLRLMEREDPESAAIYRRAMRSFDPEDMQAWVDRLCTIFESSGQREYRWL